MNIGDFNTDKKVLVIAEIGNNHEGDYSLAEEMIGRAAETGVGAVKFQTIVPDKLVSIRKEERIEQLERFRLSYDEFERLSKVAQKENILFLSTAFDIESARFLEHLIPAFKIASGDNNFYPLIEIVAGFGKPIILSCGLADLIQVNYTKAFIEKLWSDLGVSMEMAVLHCVASYPVPTSDANLGVIRTLERELGCVCGYSDHTLGIEAAVLSVGAGARIVEKHFTLDKNFSDFRDHQLSADPKEFERLVERIREAEELMGSGAKVLLECEKDSKMAVRRSIVAARNLVKGEILQYDDITWVRPGRGIPPGQESQVLGRAVRRSVNLGEAITLDILKR